MYFDNYNFFVNWSLLNSSICLPYIVVVNDIAICICKLYPMIIESTKAEYAFVNCIP
jgi:lipid-A-disaccharide synthase-like uncharacterized protein